MDFDTASYYSVERDGEVRRLAVGYLDKRLHVLVYRDDGMRVIGFRKASFKEAKKYGKAKTID